jgi:hypothetical protein
MVGSGWQMVVLIPWRASCVCMCIDGHIQQHLVRHDVLHPDNVT